MAYNLGRNEILTDVALYLQTVLVAESLSERAEIQRQQLLEKLTNREMSPARTPYMDMNGRSKGLIMKSNSFACLHQQAAYEELCSNQPIYNNVPYEDDIMFNYEPFVTGYNGYGPPSKHHLNAKRHSTPNSSGGGGGISPDGGGNLSTGSLSKTALTGSSSLSSRSNSDSSESSKSEVIYVSANAVKYSASKYGPLTKREKILFVDHTKKYWAAVLSSTMYVYNGEKELKPCLVVHLEGYVARDAAGGGNRNKDWVFEVVCPGKKSYQFIAQNQNDLHSWIEAINNSCSKPSTPEIEQLSPSPICFKQELLPNRELPVPPTATCDPAAQDCFYDKPNPIIRPVNVYENGTDDVDMIESIYHFIDESKQEKDTLPKIDKQFWDGDTSYYNIPNNIPVPVPVKEDRNNNEYDDYFAEKETSYDIITNDECEMTVADPVLGVQQIIQKIEEINSKKTSPFLRRKSQPKNNCNGPMRNSTPIYTADEFYEPMKVIKNIQPCNNNVAAVVGSQSFRKSR